MFSGNFSGNKSIIKLKNVSFRVKWEHMQLWSETHGLFSAELASPSCTWEAVERRLVGEGRAAASSGFEYGRLPCLSMKLHNRNLSHDSHSQHCVLLFPFLQEVYFPTFPWMLNVNSETLSSLLKHNTDWHDGACNPCLFKGWGKMMTNSRPAKATEQDPVSK